ncbi:MAG: MipA/OmpV family protein [Gammaproteobacteria bacterium]|nr:MAG: MipA/OmpV family protein [Gammaproteobacteria bacterium]RLA44861.1 MAG: MipA/OmpV family protein [Gammaproteobacteria bacterium]
MSRELPLWEVGVGLFPSTFPAYRGSKDQQYYLFPFPYLVYRGDFLRVDRDGLRARLFNTDRVQLNISVNASAPGRSDDSNARHGMPDLDPTVEIGPSLNILLVELTDKHRLKLRLPVRSVIATDLGSTEQAGWIFNPHLKLDSEDVFGGWNAGLSLGPLFASAKYHAYYYSVDPQYATATRPAYSASGGYSGTLVQASLSRRFNRIWMGGFIRYDNLSGAQFEDSPLVETDHSLMAGIAIAWIFKQSSQTVSVGLKSPDPNPSPQNLKASSKRIGIEESRFYNLHDHPRPHAPKNSSVIF